MAGAETTSLINPKQAEEVTSVKGQYPGQVRVIQNVGYFTNVVTIQPMKEFDVHVKFQLPG